MCAYVHESACPHCGKYIVLCMRMCEIFGVSASVCECGLEDRSKQLKVFEELPGRFLLCLWAWRGKLGVKECTDVLSDSTLFELSPQRRNPNPNTWIPDYRLMPHLDLRSQNTKSSAWYQDQKSNVLNPTVSIRIPSWKQKPFMFDTEIVSVWRSICPEFNKKTNMHDSKFNHCHRKANAVHFEWLTT